MILEYPVNLWKEKIDLFFGQKIAIDLSQIGFFKPEMLADLKCYIDYIYLTKEIKPDIIFPEDPGAKDYAGRMGLFDGIPDYTYQKNKRESDNFIPLHKINSDNNDSIADAIRTIFSNSGAPHYDGLTTAISELLDNMYYHSKTEYGTGWGYVSAQVWANAWPATLEVAVRDVGIGIVNSYVNRNRVSAGSIDVFKNAFEDLNSSTGDRGRGQGLTHVINFLKNSNGSLDLKSEDYYAHINSSGELKFSKLGSYTLGTKIIFRLPYDKN